MQLALFGDQRQTLPADSTTETAVSILGDVRLDAAAGAGPGARLTFIGLAGDLILRVPPGSRIRTNGFTVFGDPRVEVSQADGPEITVQNFSLFGDVRITDQPL